MSKAPKIPLMSYQEFRDRLWNFGASDAYCNSPEKTRTFARGLQMGLGSPNAEFYTVIYGGEAEIVPSPVIRQTLKCFGIDLTAFLTTPPDPEATRTTLAADRSQAESEADA